MNDADALLEKVKTDFLMGDMDALMKDSAAIRSRDAKDQTRLNHDAAELRRYLSKERLAELNFPIVEITGLSNFKEMDLGNGRSRGVSFAPDGKVESVVDSGKPIEYAAGWHRASGEQVLSGIDVWKHDMEFEKQNPGFKQITGFTTHASQSAEGYWKTHMIPSFGCGELDVTKAGSIRCDLRSIFPNPLDAGKWWYGSFKGYEAIYEPSGTVTHIDKWRFHTGVTRETVGQVSQELDSKPKLPFNGEPNLKLLWILPDKWLTKISERWAEQAETQESVRKESWWITNKAEAALNGDRTAEADLKKELESLTALERILIAIKLKEMNEALAGFTKDKAGQPKKECDSFPVVQIEPWPTGQENTREMVEKMTHFKFVGQCQQSGKTLTIDLPPMTVPRFTRN